LDYLAHWPPGRDRDNPALPTLYLLHGRGDEMASWLPFFDRLDESVHAGRVAPMLAITPDAPWSNRASWYVDSQFTDAADPGYAVETALTVDLVAHVDRLYSTTPHRGARIVAGYSMGGSGALRLALAHQRLFAAAIVLSPAVCTYRCRPEIRPPGHRARTAAAGGASTPTAIESCPMTCCSVRLTRRAPSRCLSRPVTTNTRTRIRGTLGTTCRSR
jgi:enterochelin esterase-like enzyme